MEKKPLINRDKWTKNDIHLLVVLVLVGIYPVLASSFFGIFYFVLIPVYALTAVSHYYWLVASLVWVLLCAAILPCLRGIDEDKGAKPAGIEAQEGTVYATAQPFIKVEDVEESKRDSILTNKSNKSREKEFEEEKAEKESLEKFRDDLENSTSSLEKGEITQSGEFLNECIDSLGPDKPQEEEAECEVHVDQSSQPQLMDELQERLKSKYKDTDIDKEDIKRVSSSESKDDMLQESKKEKDKLREKDDSDTDESISKLPRDEEEMVHQQIRSAPLELQEGNVQESKEALGEVEELSNEVPLRRKPNTTIDTSRASGYYECSMPTPKSASSDRPESNMVFLFVNPEIAEKEQDIIVNQQGQVVQQKED